MAWLPDPRKARLTLSEGATWPFLPLAHAEIMVGTAIAEAAAMPESFIKCRRFSFMGFKYLIFAIENLLPDWAMVPADFIFVQPV
jgi:hypothetical protein